MLFQQSFEYKLLKENKYEQKYRKKKAQRRQADVDILQLYFTNKTAY